MNNYTIYCTAEQTKKALELGAPLFEAPYVGYYPVIKTEEVLYEVPTAEQMVGWIREVHKIHPRIDCEGSENYVVQLQFINSSKDIDVENHNYRGIIGHRGYPSSKEATLAAIDAALKYLDEHK